MSITISKAFLYWVVILMILQPWLSYRDFLIEGIIKSNTNHIAQLAAVQGYVTPQIRDELIQNLGKIGYSPSEVNLTYSTVQVERGERIDIVVTAPRAPSFAFLFSSSDEPKNYYARANVMSEYLD